MATKPDDSAPRFHQNFFKSRSMRRIFVRSTRFNFLFYFSKGIFTEGLQQQKFAICLPDKL